jgi:ABC-2 type transport system permease protein
VIALVTAVLIIGVVMPFAFLASVGRGYLLPLAGAMLALLLANLLALAGWGDYFPWGIPGLYAQNPGALPPASFAIVALTALVGILITILWWTYADHPR